MKRQLTPFAKLLIVAAVMGAVFGGYKFASNRGYLAAIAPQGKQVGEVSKGLFNHSNDKAGKLDRPLNVGVVTWGGYAGGEYFNEGFTANANSRYTKNYGMDVNFVLIDDYNNSREAFKAGKLDVLWTTADSFPTEVEAMKDLDVKIIFQSDWSRGGDAIVTRRGINTINDLKPVDGVKKKVAVAFGTPSNTFLLWMLDAGDIKYSDIEVIQAPSAIDAASYFKAGKVDAAVVWSPDDEDCVKSVAGSKVLTSTKEASHIIADVFYARSSFIQNHPEAVKNLIEGWMIGAAEINTDSQAKEKAVKILAEGMKQPADFARNAIEKARLTTYGDNVNFFNMNGNFTGVKGEDIYNSMSVAYHQINQAPANVPAWRQMIDTGPLSKITSLEGSMHLAEGGQKFSKPTVELAKAPAISTKQVSITFPTGSAILDDNAKYIVQMKFGDLAKGFAASRIRIEGNTDSVGSPAVNKTLSLKRAQAVADFLKEQYKFNPNRFVVIGNGADKPVADNASAEGRAKNRRTDFELLN